MAVMARSLGVPSRIATGFAQGTFDSKRGVYQVYQNNAHTWVEIYFPRYGWVQFEPTASQPAIERPLPDTPGGANDDVPDPGDPSRAGGREVEDAEDLAHRPITADQLAAVQAANQSPTGWVIVIGLAALALVAGGGFLAIGWYEQRGTPAQASGGTWAFARLARMTRWLRLKLSAADTPYEQAKTIGLAVPKRRDEIDQLADLYVRERYGRAEVDLNQTRSIWQRIHWSLWVAGIKRRLPRLLSAPQRLWQRIKR
jgi:hypothetical protein